MIVNTIVLIITSQKSEILSVANRIEKVLITHGKKVIQFLDFYDAFVDRTLPDVTIDLAIVIGGDGSALKASRICSKRNIPILPINQGSFGFINEILLDEWEEALDLLEQDRCKIGSYHLLEVEIKGRNWLAFNDVTIGSIGYGTIAANIYKDKSLVTKYRADGVIISTPTGSTGHSLSIGGPIIAPGIDAFMINPIAPFSLSNRPIILPIDQALEVRIEHSRHECVLVLDGKVELGLMKGANLIIRDSKLKSRIVHSPQRTYFEILRNKLGWAGEYRA